MFTDELRWAVTRGASASDLKDLCTRSGTQPIVHDGWIKVQAGLTTVEEVARRMLGLRKGFTLIELLVTIAIIAILAAIVAPAVFRNVGDAKASAARSQIEILALALDAYRLDNDDYPTVEQGLAALADAAHGGRDPAQLAGPLSAPDGATRSVGAAIRLRRAWSGEPNLV